jgi:DTW domain-containing protein
MNLGRPTCFRCFRPMTHCYCARAPRIDTRTEVLFVQHPRERMVPINTCRIAHLCLPNSRLVSTTDIDHHPALQPHIAAPADTAVVFPGPDAQPLSSLSSPPKRIIFVDGTWSQAKKLLKLNPVLASLPRVAFTPAAPSRYRIRKEPQDDYVSTLEAVAHVLGVLEADAVKLLPLLDPFEEMVDRQIEAAQGSGGSRHRFVRGSARGVVPELLALQAAATTGVLVVVEANCYPIHARIAGQPEALQMVAMKLSDPTQTLDVLLKPRRPLAPAAPQHLDIPADDILAGLELDDALTRLRAFVGDAPWLTWRTFARDVLVRDGMAEPTLQDIRLLAARTLKSKSTRIDVVMEQLGAAVSQPALRGRAGYRVVQLHAVVTALLARIPTSGA